jgi:hypothetical protein
MKFLELELWWKLLLESTSSVFRTVSLYSRMLFCMQDSKSLLFMMKVVVWFFLSVTTNVMTSLILIVGFGLSQFGYLQSSFVKFSLQSHGYILDSRHPESTWRPGLEVCLVWPFVIKKTLKKHLLTSRQLKTYGPIIQSLCMPNPTGETQLPGKPWQRWEKCAQVWRRMIYALLLTLPRNSTMHLYCAKNSEINK